MKRIIRIPTYVKYFLSYMLVFTVLMLGAYMIIRRQIIDSYFEQRSAHIQTNLTNIAGQLNEELAYLSQLNIAFGYDSVLKHSSYKEQLTDIETYKVNRELDKYVVYSQIINDIVYMSKINERPFSIQYSVAYEDGNFLIYDQNTRTVLEFDPTPYIGTVGGKLLFLQEDEVSKLLYMPEISSQSNEVWFYFLSVTDVMLKLQGMVSEEVFSLALVSNKGEIVTGINTDDLKSFLTDAPLKRGISKTVSGEVMCVADVINRDFALVAVLSDDLLASKVNSAFVSTYAALLFLGVVGLCLVLLSMRMTYRPLYHLTKKIDSDAKNSRDHIEYLDHAFTDTVSENRLMRIKLDNYRFFIRKSLLESIVSDASSKDTVLYPNVPDSFFEQCRDKKIFVLLVSSLSGPLLEERFETKLKSAVPDIGTCVILEHRAGKATYLLDYNGIEPDKRKKLLDVLMKLYREEDWLSALSYESESPLDIPALYYSVTQASENWPGVPVAEGLYCNSGMDVYVYPHDKLEEMSNALVHNDFSVADQLLESLIDVVDSCKMEDNNMVQNYFIPCLLIDMLMILINCMSRSQIPFGDYNELYYELLYLCRSFSYFEKREEIVERFKQLLDVYESKIDEVLHTVSIRQIMEECYSQPGFSIEVLAERFSMNISKMSYIFKKGQNMNFADYLWELRLSKAKELLTTTPMPVDEVSIAVGYYSVSGFRRKFKSSTGYTPSEYREVRSPI